MEPDYLHNLCWQWCVWGWGGVVLRMYPLTPLWRADFYLSVPQNHSDSCMTLFEGHNFQGCKFEHSDDYPSLSSMDLGQ